MKILGLNCSYNSLNHDPSACLMINGKIVSAMEEERFNREKFTKKFPIKSILECLKYAKIDLKKIKTPITLSLCVRDEVNNNCGNLQLY